MACLVDSEPITNGVLRDMPQAESVRLWLRSTAGNANAGKLH